MKRALLLAGLVLAFGAAEAGERAQLQYIQYCSGCHLPDGTGSPAKGIPTMRGTLGRLLQLDGGRAYIVQVPGVMNSPLNDREVAAVMNWLVPVMSPAASNPAYTPEEIARLRASRPADIPALRRELIARGHAAGIEIDH
ncbi:hypothetical protein [Pelomonas sp. KK5]|uniref:c-type cytochrome n=1 Tax=Pelomonas sp. KK5 TaxID=1855730 RepID=UPI00097C24EC|nr:hypothetical protein [Pelomonas sp. KK5]